MNLHFVPAVKMVVEGDTWFQTFGQFIGFHFLDLNPDSYDLDKMKFDLDVSTKVRFKWPGLALI